MLYLVKGAAVFIVLLCLLGWGVGTVWVVSHAVAAFHGQLAASTRK